MPTWWWAAPSSWSWPRPASGGGGAKLMLVGFPTAPIDLYQDGTLFMDPLTLKVRGTALPGGPFSIAIPSDPTLVGIQVALQFWCPQSKLTDPYIAIVEP